MRDQPYDVPIKKGAPPVVSNAANYPVVPPIHKWDTCNPKDAPYASGVYAIIVDSELLGANTIAYIGESVCLANRLRSHHVIISLIDYGFAPIIRFFPAKYHFHIEPKLIQKHRPPLNVSSNTGVDRRFMRIFLNNKKEGIEIIIDNG